MEMNEGVVEVAIHGLPNHGGVEVVGDGHAGAVVEQEEGVQHDVERVNRELVFPLHPVHELELYRVGLVVAQCDERPTITVIHFDHF